MTSLVTNLRAAYQRWHDSRGGEDSMWVDLMHPNCCMRSLGGGREGLEFSKTANAHEGIAEYFAILRRDWEMLYYEPQEYIAEANRVAVLGRCGWRSRRTGKSVETPFAHFWTFIDSLASEFFEFYDTAAAAAAATAIVAQ